MASTSAPNELCWENCGPVSQLSDFAKRRLRWEFSSLDSSPAILRILFAERGASKSAPRTGGEMAHSGAELAKNGTQQARMRFNVGEGQSGTKAALKRAEERRSEETCEPALKGPA